jgi:hypothetical protein
MIALGALTGVNLQAAETITYSTTPCHMLMD